MDSGIGAIVGLYVRLGNVAALSSLKAHREELLSKSTDTEHFNLAPWRDCYHRDLRAIDAGIEEVLNRATLEGYVDSWHPRRIAGWVRYAKYPDIAVRLGIFFDGELAGQVVADRYREDLEKAGIGNGRHGFEFVPAAETFAAVTMIELRTPNGAVVSSKKRDEQPAAS